MVDPVGMESLLAKLNAARATLAQGAQGVATPAAARGAKPVDFAALLQKSLAGVDNDQVQATTLAERFQLGDPKVTLEETMVAVQKASLSFQQLAQVRNRVVTAYHDIMNMQV